MANQKTSQMTEWRPFSPLFQEFPSLFQSFFGNDLRRFMGEGLGRLEPSTGLQWNPRVNLKETPEAYVIEAEIPGCKPEEVKVTLTGDTISIHGEKRSEEKRQDEQWHVWERSQGVFQRTFTFPTPVDDKSIEAEAQDGVLTITVKKSTKAPSRTIEVTAKNGEQAKEQPKPQQPKKP